MSDARPPCADAASDSSYGGMEGLRVEALAAAVRAAHRAEPTWRETAHVREMFGDALLVEAEVHVFDLIGHARAARAFAWSIQVGKKRKIYTVLAVPPVDTPLMAVRAMVAGAATIID